MKFCYHCGEPFTDLNISEEHIILNACGGRLKSKDLLCKKCNSEFGSTYDQVLASQTNHLANLLHIKRDRDKPPDILGKVGATGKKIRIPYEGNMRMDKPEFSETKEGNQTKISAKARDEKEYGKMVMGLKRKYPFINEEELYKAAIREKGYLNDHVSIGIELGGDGAFRSITKSAINYFIHKGGDRKYITHLFPFLLGADMADIVWFHYPYSPYYETGEREVSHIIKLVGDQKERILYCYLELFNCQNYVVKLNENYDGVPIDETYIYHLLESREVDKPVDMQFSRDQLTTIYQIALPDLWKFIILRYERVVGIADQIQVNAHISNLPEQVLQEALKGHPKGGSIPEEVIKQCRNDIREKIVAFLEHREKGKESIKGITRK